MKQDNKSFPLCKEIAQSAVTHTYMPQELAYEHGSQLAGVAKRILLEHMYVQCVHNMYYIKNVLAAVVSIISYMHSVVSYTVYCIISTSSAVQYTE